MKKLLFGSIVAGSAGLVGGGGVLLYSLNSGTQQQTKTDQKTNLQPKNKIIEPSIKKESGANPLAYSYSSREQKNSQIMQLIPNFYDWVNEKVSYSNPWEIKDGFLAYGARSLSNMWEKVVERNLKTYYEGWKALHLDSEWSKKRQPNFYDTYKNFFKKYFDDAPTNLYDEYDGKSFLSMAKNETHLLFSKEDCRNYAKAPKKGTTEWDHWVKYKRNEHLLFQKAEKKLENALNYAFVITEIQKRSFIQNNGT